MGVDLLASFLAIALVVWLTLDVHHDARPVPPWALIAFAGNGLFQVGLMFVNGVYGLVHRYLGFRDVGQVALTTLLPGASLAYMQYVLQWVGRNSGVTLVFILYVCISITLFTSERLLYRLRQRRNASRLIRAEQPLRTLIVGAGDAGDAVLAEYERKGVGTQHVIGFVDDDPFKADLAIRGVPVIGTVDDVEALVERHKINEVLVALPSATGSEMRRVFQHCGRSAARVRTLPGLQDLVGTYTPLTRQLREFQIEDLLRREPVQTDQKGISEYIKGRSVLVTGGGGSIGSELARQIATMHPERLVLVGKGENSLYEIQQELLQTREFRAEVIVADVRDERAMRRVFRTYRPSAVFHAAAHKHVPLMEANVGEAIENNVLGTVTCASLAVEFECRKFTFISTDKAVRPSSVMGASKRLCEMAIASYRSNPLTEFSIVRFGNVLGSRGSLVPLLNSQIKRGGPITLTDPQMTRYFMTIPEAVQLVLQATAFVGSGDVFILDMGEPVRIEELALELVRLHGLMPGDDIAIRYIGARPGEKLHEELVYDLEKLESTAHPKIRATESPCCLTLDDLLFNLDRILSEWRAGREAEARDSLVKLANDPESHIVRDLSLPELIDNDIEASLQ